jgi:hypothetical protein
MNNCPVTAAVLISCAISFSVASLAQDSNRQDEVAKRGEDVMPFSHTAAMHIFTKTADGGTMRIVVKDATSAKHIPMIRTHLQDLQARFQKGDYSGPSHIHGNEMPGLAQLKAAKPGKITVSYHELERGAELRYQTTDAKLISALHDWFDAQLSDHGNDAMPGH